MPVFVCPPPQFSIEFSMSVCLCACAREWPFVPTALGLEPISTCSAWAWSVDYLSPCGTCLLFFVSGRRRDLRGPLFPPHLPAISPVIPTLLEQFFYHSIYANVIPADVQPGLKNVVMGGGWLRKMKQTKKKKNRKKASEDKTHVPRVREKVIVVLCSFFNPSLTQSYTFRCVGLCVCVIIQVLCVFLKGPCPHPPSLHLVSSFTLGHH